MHRWTSWIARVTLVSLVAVTAAVSLYAIIKIITWFTEAAEHTYWNAFMWDTGGGLLFIVVLLLMTVIVWAVAKLLGKVTGMSSIGLGLSNPDHNLILRVRAQRYSGLDTVSEHRRYKLKEIMDGSKGLLLHSRLYSHPRAIKHIGNWMHKQSYGMGSE